MVRAGQGPGLGWGRGWEGQLNVPNQLGPFTQVYAGGNHACATRADRNAGQVPDPDLAGSEAGVETTVYDNGTDQSIGGGSIVVHTKK